MYNVYVKRIFVITEIVHMNEKTGTCVNSKKEKVKESQSRSVTPSLDTLSGAGLGRHKESDQLRLYRQQGLSARSPIAHFDELDYSAQAMQPRGQISSGYIANKALAPGA